VNRAGSERASGYSTPRQRPIRSDFAFLDASASAGSSGSMGFAQPCRTIQVERSVPETAQRAVNDELAPTNLPRRGFLFWK